MTVACVPATVNETTAWAWQLAGGPDEAVGGVKGTSIACMYTKPRPNPRIHARSARCASLTKVSPFPGGVSLITQTHLLTALFRRLVFWTGGTACSCRHQQSSKPTKAQRRHEPPYYRETAILHRGLCRVGIYMGAFLFQRLRVCE
jgi:hypothetical protein